LGPSNFGLLNYVTSFIALFTSFTALGLDGIVVRDLVQQAERGELPGDTIIGTTFFLRSAALAIAVPAALITLYFSNLKDHAAIAMGIIIAVGSLFQAFNVIDLWFQYRVESKNIVIGRNIALLLMALARIGLILMRAPLIAFAWVLFGEYLLGTITAIIVYHFDKQHIRRWRLNIPLAVNLLKQGWPLMFASVAVYVYMRIDQIMLKNMAGDYQAGIYAAATRVSEAWYFIPTAIAASVNPTLFRSREIGESIYYGRFQQLFAIMSGISISIAVLTMFGGSFVVHLLFGPQYYAAAPVLVVHIWAAVFVFWGVAQDPWFINEGLMKAMLLRTAVGALVNIAINIVFIPRYGAMGAAIATVIAYAIPGCLWNFFDYRTRRIFYLQLKSILFPIYLFRSV
ncbi:MAG TPA: flippase, partial [Tepidisphaeraceae bacterium]|nr:flippase [Tepidisphaeraceae bacterium]